MKASDNLFPKALFDTAAAIATPAAGTLAVYAKADNLLYYMASDGVEHPVSAAAAIGELAGINDQTGTSYTLALTDKGKDVRCNNAAAVALTIPPNSDVAFSVGTWLLFSQGGAGVVTATAGAGVTINAANGSATTAQYDVRGLEKIATDTWRVL